MTLSHVSPCPPPPPICRVDGCASLAFNNELRVDTCAISREIRCRYCWCATYGIVSLAKMYKLLKLFFSFLLASDNTLIINYIISYLDLFLSPNFPRIKRCRERQQFPCRNRAMKESPSRQNSNTLAPLKTVVNFTLILKYTHMTLHLITIRRNI